MSASPSACAPLLSPVVRHCAASTGLAYHVQDTHLDSAFGLQVMECYPELFSKVLVLNAPSFFSAIWRLIKPFIPPRTAEKVAYPLGRVYSGARGTRLDRRPVLNAARTLPLRRLQSSRTATRAPRRF